MRSLFYALVAVIALSLFGCGGGGNSGGSTNPVLQSIQVTPGAPSVTAGATQQFKATGSFTGGTTKDLTSSVTWSSSNTAVTSINASGLATSIKGGTTTISAASSGISGSTTLTVAPALTSISVTPPTVSIAATTATSFSATGTFDDGSTKNVTGSVTWTSSVTAVATISDTVPTKGTVMGLTPGPTTITATSGSIFGTATLTVTNATLNSIAVTPATIAIPLGVQQQFTATGTFSDSTTQDITNTVTWASSGTSIASITVSGFATGLKLGTVTVTATSGSTSGTASLTVNASNLTSLAVTPGIQSIAQNTSQQFTAVGTFNDGSTRNLTGQVTWTSSDTTVATIGSGNGVAKAVTVVGGTTTITATLGAKTATATLNVTNATVTSITVTPSSRTIAPGSKLGFTATGLFSDSSTQVITTNVVWASDNASAATVNAVGIASGVAAGTANITATLGGVTGTAPLTVSGATLTSLAITPPSTVLAPASTLIYQAVGTYSDNSTQNISNVVTWTSSDSNVALIASSGQVTGESPGTAIITAKLGTVTGTANIVVQSSTLQSIAITPPTASIPGEVGVQYTAIATFADTSTQDLTNSVTWTSSAPSVATISNSAGSVGLAVGVSPGNSTITASFAGVVGTATITVTNATLTTIVVSSPTSSIAVGGTEQYTATGHYSDTSTFNITGQVAWTSSNIQFAVINSSGLANGAAAGTTTIKAAQGTVNGTATLTVQ